MDVVYIYKCRYGIQEEKFRYGIRIYTGPFRVNDLVVRYSRFPDFIGSL
jgi:hypothetical protein